MNRLLWLVLGVIGVGLLLLLVNHQAGETLGLPNDAFASALYLGIWGVVVAVVIIGSGQRLGEMARNAAIWLMALLLLSTVYLYRFELRDVGMRLVGGLMPGTAISRLDDDGTREAVLTKGLGGHFQARVDVDGQTLNMMIDTGASTVALSYRDAERVGIDVNGLQFVQPVRTANGVAMAAPITLQEISVGGISRSNVRAGVLERGKLSESLLGMSYLGTLSSVQMTGDQIILRD